MGKFIDLTGQRFGKLTVLKKSNEKTSSNYIKWDCVCDCSTLKTVSGKVLRRGESNSCGCIRKDNPNRFIDLTGHKYGRLTVIEKFQVERKNNERIKWKCLCECGNYTIVSTCNLRTGEVKSCKCIKLEVITKHGYFSNGKEHDIYGTWETMKQRCLNPNNHQYKNYGGRGITVCDRWINSFENFLEDMGERPSKNHSIDRIDVNGNYEPSNCRWATRIQQGNNKRNNVNITYKNETRTKAEWSRYFNTSKGNLDYHLRRKDVFSAFSQLDNRSSL